MNNNISNERKLELINKFYYDGIDDVCHLNWRDELTDSEKVFVESLEEELEYELFGLCGD